MPVKKYLSPCLFSAVFLFMVLFFIAAPVRAASNVSVALQIPIMGEVTIPICQPHSETGPDGRPKEIFECTGIARYIALSYQWIVAFTAVLAVLAFTVAGVLWLTAGGDSSKVTESKQVMSNALIGLALALGSYLLLNVINPNLVRFNALRVPGIATIDIDLQQIEVYGEETGDTGPGTIEMHIDGKLEHLDEFIKNNQQFGRTPDHCLGWVRDALTSIFGNTGVNATPLMGSGLYPANAAKAFSDAGKFTPGLSGIKNGDVVFMKTIRSGMADKNTSALSPYSITHIGIYYNGSVYHQYGSSLRKSKVDKVPTVANEDHVFSDSPGMISEKVIGYGSMGL